MPSGFLLVVIWFNFNLFFILNFRDFHRLDNKVDLGLQSAKGLKPPKLATREICTAEKGKPHTISLPPVLFRSVFSLGA